jgi:hypothetical protein
MKADLYRCWVDVTSNFIWIWHGFRRATRAQAKRFKRIGDYCIIGLDIIYKKRFNRIEIYIRIHCTYNIRI